MEEWKEYKLGGITSKIGSGATPKGGKESYLGGNIALIRSQNILDFAFTNSGLVYINKDQASKLNNVEVKENDILLNITGDSVARVCIVPQKILPARVNQHVAIIRGNDIVDNRYLLYYLQYIKPYLLSLSQGGATRNALTKKMLEDLDIKVPSKNVQNIIISVLSSLDDKIELNRRINENLEQQAQALFKSWFVDFEPFKDGKFVDSELGMIPEGWKVISIGEIVKEMNTGGDAIQKTPIVEYNTGIKCIRVGDFTNNRAVNDWGFTNVNDDIYKQYKLNRGDILITRTASIGLVRYIFNDLNAVYNNGIIRLIINENVLPSLFVYCYLNSCLFSNHISKIIGETSVRPNMKINYVSKFKLLLPTNTVSNKFTSIVSSIYGKIEKNILEIYKLSQLRDTLLPRLMSGKLEIKDNSYD